jgi:UDP-N-acetylmuramate dehydrogenase
MALSNQFSNVCRDVSNGSTAIPNIQTLHSSSGSLSSFQPLGRQRKSIRLPNSQCLIQPEVSLAKFTSFRVGGPAELYVAPRTVDDLQESLSWANQHDVPTTLLGAGTNLLVSDRGIPGLVICTRYLRHTVFDAEAGCLIAGAGEPIARLAWQAAERGWSGLEWAAGIPGTVGGAVVMNAGAHRLCTADVLNHIQVLSIDGETSVLSSDELGYSYRSSILQGKNLFVTQATFRLQMDNDPQTVVAQTSAHLEYRRTTQPYHLPSCGSVFRNPDSYTAGWLIEQTGLKGHQIGGAQIAQRHANFILNIGHASANDIFHLIQHVQHQVEQHWSLWLHPEVKLIGEF